MVMKFNNTSNKFVADRPAEGVAARDAQFGAKVLAVRNDLAILMDLENRFTPQERAEFNALAPRMSKVLTAAWMRATGR